ncbi:dicarboxylate/amino acid:cation symporter [Planctomyces sp. SH-PL62]|uniref:dicarboxylate/amino acid:cation symporter n=1 Tax=Planctomyces sp. SH-PL62 TaxID=1636152 RepID=UPI00078B5DE3|nr:dicarboxylate/amino acid:cation symporter [Planctomyces sp. SH-PL62]AMV36532.1 C4-dicarboxylate transport protein [Planctomyces sp. SH-PL62]
MPPSEFDHDAPQSFQDPVFDPAFGALVVEDEPESRPGGLPLYVWVLIAVGLAIPIGLGWGEGAQALELLPNLIMRALTALAAPLVVMAILHAIVTNDIRGKQGGVMMLLYLINTLIAMLIGLVLSNLIRPGLGASLGDAGGAAAPIAQKSASELVVELIPRSIGEAFATNNIAQLVVLTLALGIGLVKIRNAHRLAGKESFQTVVDLLSIGFELLMKVLLWVVALVPLAVLGVVASRVGQQDGMRIFLSLIWLVVVVVLGLGCQVVWYLLQMAVFTRVSPIRFLSGAADVMANTFSTASTAATIPITLRSLNRMGVSRQSSQLCACIGTNFNNDGTALYQATAALFMAQALGFSLSLTDQILVVLTTLVASVGAGGIPSGSFVTMPLIFAAVRLPADKIPILLTIDWFLDRCRTTSNVLGDMTVAVLLDKFVPPTADPVES